MINENKRVLYISPDGILEPLGDSQVLKYLEKLSKKFTITLISYEKINDLRNTDYIMNNTFFVGVYPGIDDEQIEYMLDTFTKFFQNN